MLWLGVHFPHLPLEVVMTGGDAPGVVLDERSRVIFRNRAAVRAGIARGSTLATAHSIVRGLVHERRDLQREQRRLTLLGEALYGFSARVCLAPPPSADDPPAGVALEIGASLKLFGNTETLAERVRNQCRDMGHRVRVRWAATPLAALILARSNAGRLEQVPLGHAAVEPQRLPAERIERCANMGINTLGQLLELPARGVARRFGEDLVDYLARLTGERPDPRPGIRPAEQFQTTLHLLEPLRSKEALAFPMQRLLTDLQHWLVARQLAAAELRWHFAGSGAAEGANRRTCMSVRFARGQQSREAFLDITRLELAGTALPEDIVDIGLEARRLVAWPVAGGAASGSLFGNLPGLQATALVDDVLVDQLCARLGRDACCTLQVADQHAPEHAWRPARPLQPAERARPTAAGLQRRPLWLFDPPRPVARRQLELLDGPERIHTGWWLTGQAAADPPGQARDYYVARHPNGARCWVFTDPWERWFLHGYFA